MLIRRKTVILPRIGTFRAIEVQPEYAFQGLFVRRGAVTVYLEEKSRVPLEVRVRIPIGEIIATLISAENSALLKAKVGADANPPQER